MIERRGHYRQFWQHLPAVYELSLLKAIIVDIIAIIFRKLVARQEGHYRQSRQLDTTYLKQSSKLSPLQKTFS